ncbi:MAG: SMC-Scp complex subunit ScpB [Candidatus Krumholzibacteriia bacterium]
MNLNSRLEALLFASDQPLTLGRLDELLPDADRQEIQLAVEALEKEYESTPRGFHVARVAGGFQLMTKPQLSDVVRRLFVGKRRVRLTKAALEALAIIAYKQPTTRPEIDAIRGVSSGGVVETLLERSLIRIAGRAEGVGRPLLYATTPEFLQYLGLNRLKDLPSLEELEAMLSEREEEARRQEREELLELAEAHHAAAVAALPGEGEVEATLDEKLRSRNLPTLAELDDELHVRGSRIQEVSARVAAERREAEGEPDSPAAVGLGGAPGPAGQRPETAAVQTPERSAQPAETAGRSATPTDETASEDATPTAETAGESATLPDETASESATPTAETASATVAGPAGSSAAAPLEEATGNAVPPGGEGPTSPPEAERGVP